MRINGVLINALERLDQMEIALGNNPDQLAAIEYGQVPDLVFAHQAVRVCEGSANADGVHRWCHVVTDRLLHVYDLAVGPFPLANFMALANSSTL
jgi:hypothetical protein